MHPASVEYMENLLMRLLQIPSPSGDTEDIVKVLETELAHLGYSSERNRKGGLIVSVPGEDNARQRFITAHVDTLGAMVREILPSGRLRIAPIGGYAWNTIEGEYCGVKTDSGRVISGTVLLHNTSVHVNRQVGTTERSDENMEVVLDAKVFTKDDVECIGIRIGDFVFFDPRAQITAEGFVKSRHLDDKASVAIVFAVLRELAENAHRLPHAVTVLISNNEEIGYGGNSNVPAEAVEYVAVDMGAIGDGQATDEYCVSICAKDASGPYHAGLRKQLERLAAQRELNYKVDLYPHYGSDASAALRAGVDVKHGLIGPGVANSHAYERTHKEALLNTAQLLTAYLQSSMLD